VGFSTGDNEALHQSLAVTGRRKKEDAIVKAGEKDIAAGVSAPSIAETKGDRRGGLHLRLPDDRRPQRDVRVQRRQDLVSVLDVFALPAYDIMAAYPQKRHVPAKVRSFVEHLKSIYAAPDYWLQAR
jgi:hypothetical protein